ncbi:MAG TPA: hypothetical protein VG934_00995 [Candidatus Paceibacterota bacterium]|nr:hypothetical protein [Candidatus Paceibacterota bacterium]
MAELTREHLDRHVHSRLRNRVRLYLGISAAIIIAIIYRVIVHGGGVWYPLAVLVIGIVVGSLLSRMYITSWDEDSAKVVSRMDIYGGILLGCYIVFEIAGEHFIRQWFAGPEVLTIILALAGGAVLGRGVGMARNMLAVLRENI